MKLRYCVNNVSKQAHYRCLFIGKFVDKDNNNNNLSVGLHTCGA